MTRVDEAAYVEVPVMTKISSISSFSNCLGSSDFIYVPSSIVESESSLQKKVTSNTVATITSFRVPVETTLGLSNLSLKYILSLSKLSTYT